jgi:hypothetical protein
MKKKILNDIKVIIVILIGVTILFAIIGSFNVSNQYMIERMTNDVPCYADTVKENDAAGYASYNQNNSDYILKTKIVPPKGTACPTQISPSASNYLDSAAVAQNIQNIQNSAASSSSTSNTFINNQLNPLESNSNTQVPAPAEMPQASAQLLNEIKGSISQINQQKPKNDTCPPCPACERCPEPAFDCKKVPNYRSPSMGQYLPMPVLNDFSNF